MCQWRHIIIISVSSSTSDKKSDAFDVLWLIWILHCVHALVSFTHSVYNEVAEVAVEFDPIVDHHTALHQDHIRRPGGGPVLKRDLHPERGQHDVKVLSVEQGHDVPFHWMTQWTKEGVSIGKNTRR